MSSFLSPLSLHLRPNNTRITASVSEKQFASRIKDVTQIHERGAFLFSPCSAFLSVDASAYTEHSRPSPLIPNNNFAYPAIPLLSDWAATDDWVYCRLIWRISSRLIDSLFDQHRSPFSDFLQISVSQSPRWQMAWFVHNFRERNKERKLACSYVALSSWTETQQRCFILTKMS